MEDRRTFIKILAAGLAVPRSVLGANDRVQMGVIGTGTRGNQVYQSFMRNKDVVFVTGCDVRKSRLDKFVADSGAKMTAVGDYRRVLDNKDVDAVLITTPDHWHNPMVIEALKAGKDIYCEKPISNTLDAAIQMTEACRNSKQVVQVGCQQRIRYAEAERFGPPKPVQPWDGIKNAQVWGPACPIPPMANVSADEFVFPHRYWVESENCQVLNVWTQNTRPAAKKPVMAWMHVGALGHAGLVHRAMEGRLQLC